MRPPWELFSASQPLPRDTPHTPWSQQNLQAQPFPSWATNSLREPGLRSPWTGLWRTRGERVSGGPRQTRRTRTPSRMRLRSHKTTDSSEVYISPELTQLAFYYLSYARFSELSSNHRTDLNVGGHYGGCPQ